MFCIYCGKEIPNNSVFCVHCGKKQDVSAESEQAQVNENAPAQANQPGQQVTGEKQASDPTAKNNAKPRELPPFAREYFFRMAHNNIRLQNRFVIFETKNAFGKITSQQNFNVSDLVRMEYIKPTPFTVGILRFYVRQGDEERIFYASCEWLSNETAKRILRLLSQHTGIQPIEAAKHSRTVSKRSILLCFVLLVVLFLFWPTGSDDVPSEPVNAAETQTSEQNTEAPEEMPLDDAATSGESVTNAPNASVTQSSNGSSSAQSAGGNNAAASGETIGQRNALRSAQSYLQVMAFSREGLIEQLEYEQFSHEDAVYAVDHCGADWNEQALECAKSYLNTTAFSYQGLVDQLEYEGFTSEQARYGVDRCGADWNEQAAKSAASYLRVSSFSRESLIAQLEYEGFTHEQAVYGVEANGF